MNWAGIFKFNSIIIINNQFKYFKMKNLKTPFFALLAFFSLVSCSKDEEIIAVNPEEVITTVTIVFTPADGSSLVTLTSRDLDGEGPNNPIVTVSGTFAQNKTYNGDVRVLNEYVSPSEDKTSEIISEGVDHQFFYQKTGNLPAFNYAPMTTTPTNFDSNGQPVGNKTVFVTTTAATGTLKITLRHEGDKTNPNVVNGDITNATGATDFEVVFTGLIVQ